MSDEKVVAAKAKVQRLLEIGFIREVIYPSWLANVVMVKKKNSKWRMCIDFTNLNKCCMKDDFPLSRIDKVVDSTARCETMTLAERSLPFFKVLRGSGRFEWGSEKQEAFDAVKDHIQKCHTHLFEFYISK
jgi:hypothetical protein